MSNEVVRTIDVNGFDPGDEPMIQVMSDGRLVVMFEAMPPFITETDPAKGRAFDMNQFGAELEAAAGVSMIWEDREVFVIPEPKNDTAERLVEFLGNFWTRSSKPWWKIW